MWAFLELLNFHNCILTHKTKNDWASFIKIQLSCPIIKNFILYITFHPLKLKQSLNIIKENKNHQCKK